MCRVLRCSLLAALAIATCAICSPLAHAEPGDPIETGREAFDTGDYPWYDAEADDVWPLRVRSGATEVKGESGERRVADEEGEDNRSITISPGGAMAGLEIVAWVAVGAVVVALVGVLLYAVLQSEGPTAKKSDNTSVSGGVDLAALPVPIAAADSDLLAEARRWYDQGEFGRAMIYLYSHVLLRLDKGQLIRLAKGKTNRQYLREVGGRTSLCEYFESAMHAFESAFFGRRDLPRDEFESAWRRVDDFHRMIDEAHA